ncbi:MAG: DUF4143 domain-containing protein [Candidatus Peribacteria bacterium]|jgi:predicted AAA+ superfamily ATPase|nr:DUF4143 domain-containing protein [Candidatus Peribacteria bacterium]
MFGVSQPTVNKYLYIMQKSYSIGVSRPFWTNLSAELTKMPKVYFFDLGLRNSLLRNFDPIANRLDKGQFFENIVRREAMIHYGLDNVKYRRTQHKNEVDLIIEEKQAYEVKFNKNLIKESKYQVFKEKYPKIPLKFVTFDEVLEWMIHLK